MSARRRRRSRYGTSVHGGSGNETVGAPVAGDAEATALMPGHPTDYALTSGVFLTYTDADPDTIARGDDSFVTEGWKAGMKLIASSAANAGLYTLDTVVALTLTLIAADALTGEGAASPLRSQNTVPGDNTNRAPV